MASKLRPKILSANKICLFSKMSYLLACFVSDFDLLKVDRYQSEEQANFIILEWTWQSITSVNQIGVFFNLQYLLTGLVSEFDFLDAYRDQ